MALQPYVGPWPLFQFLNLYSRQNSLDRESGRLKAAAYTQTSMYRVEFEPTIPVFKRAKMFHPIDRAATVIGR